MPPQSDERTLRPRLLPPHQLRARFRGFENFRVAMEEAPGRLELLHQALEKSQGAVVIRGGWQRDDPAPKRHGSSYAACPLSILFADEKREVEATVRASEEALARHGFTPADFYQAWDAGLIGAWELLSTVDQKLTESLLGGLGLVGRWKER